MAFPASYTDVLLCYFCYFSVRIGVNSGIVRRVV